VRILVVLLIVLGCVVSPTTAAPADTAWVRPVDGRVVRPFEPPATPYGPGHLGVDFAAAPNTPVRAAGAGVVVFAGRIGSAFHVVVLHVGDLRTSYDFLASIRVRRDMRVRAGDIVGTSGGRGDEHDGNVVHLGLRRGDEYLDPMILFAAVDLPAVVHLAPLSDGESMEVDGAGPGAAVLHIESASLAGARFTHQGLRAA
jgi:murein DD-endopeptidase MepM/ murein hydrolase activator NlpD